MEEPPCFPGAAGSVLSGGIPCRLRPGWGVCTLRSEMPSHLVGLQSARVAGQPVDDVPGDHVPRATGKGRVGGAGVFQLLPLAGSVNCPVQPETEIQNKLVSSLGLSSVLPLGGCTLYCYYRG